MLGRRTGLSGFGLALFVIVALVLASVIARVLGFFVHLVFALAWYVAAFVIAVAILSWLWNRVSGNDRRVRDTYLRDRDEYGRRRY